MNNEQWNFFQHVDNYPECHVILKKECRIFEKTQENKHTYALAQAVVQCKCDTQKYKCATCCVSVFCKRGVSSCQSIEHESLIYKSVINALVFNHKVDCLLPAISVVEKNGPVLLMPHVADWEPSTSYVWKTCMPCLFSAHSKRHNIVASLNIFCSILKQILSGLSILHAHRIIHNDIAENVLVNVDAQILIIDFEKSQHNDNLIDARAYEQDARGVIEWVTSFTTPMLTIHPRAGILSQSEILMITGFYDRHFRICTLDAESHVCVSTIHDMLEDEFVKNIFV